MKIVINTILLLSPLTGVGKYIYHIAKTLRAIDPTHDYTYFKGYYSKHLLSPGEHLQGFNLLKEKVKELPWLGSLARECKDLLNFFSTQTFDVYFEPNFIPLKISARHTVATIPDFSFALYPQWHPQEKVLHFKKHFHEKIKRAEKIIVISNFIKEEAIHQFNFSKDRIIPIHLGIDREIYRIYPPRELVHLRERYGLPEKFILFVGSIEPRKNLMNLVKSYAALPEAIRKEFKLVLVGFKGWENEDIMKIIEKLKSDVFYVGYIPEEDLGKIYNLARLFVYPSFYEGFGLPPLEAMACGCPVIVSATASLPEVCGEAAYYINPHEEESITAGMERILGDEGLSAVLSARGLERVKFFSWEKAAWEHLKVFQGVANESPG